MTRTTLSRLALWTFGGVAVVIAFVVIWVGVRGVLAVEELAAVRDAAATLTSDVDPSMPVDAGDVDGLRNGAAAAHALTSDPVWKLAETAPWVGPQLGAVADVAEAVDTIAGAPLEAITTVGESWNPESLRPVDGRFDVAALTDVQDAATRAAAGLAEASALLDGVDETVLLAPISSQLVAFRAQVDDLSSAADGLSRASRLLPTLLGADRPQNLLVLVQNNAEWRSLGGIPGAAILIQTDGGRIDLAGQRAASSFPQYERPILPLSDDVRGVYDDWPGMWMQNVTQVADFEVGAQLAQSMWQREQGQEVDAVVAVDPVALSYLLAATGPITLPTGDVLSADTAVSLLLNEVYLRYRSPADQDAFFAVAASSVFDALTAGNADPVKLLDAFSRMASERRLLVWTADADTRSIVAGTPLAGELPATDAETARFGVYLNDGTGSKMDYYLGATASVSAISCAATTASAAVTVTLRNDAPSADQLPAAITGGGFFGVPAGTARTRVYVYLPEGWELVGVDAPGAIDQSGGIHEGRRVVSFSLDLQSGQESTAIVTAQGPTSHSAEALITPTVNADDTQQLVRLC